MSLWIFVTLFTILAYNNLCLINLLKTFAPFKANHFSLWTTDIPVSVSFIQPAAHSHKHLTWFPCHHEPL